MAKKQREASRQDDYLADLGPDGPEVGAPGYEIVGLVVYLATRQKRFSKELILAYAYAEDMVNRWVFRDGIPMKVIGTQPTECILDDTAKTLGSEIEGRRKLEQRFPQLVQPRDKHLRSHFSRVRKAIVRFLKEPVDDDVSRNFHERFLIEELKRAEKGRSHGLAEGRRKRNEKAAAAKEEVNRQLVELMAARPMWSKTECQKRLADQRKERGEKPCCERQIKELTRGAARQRT